MENEQQQGSDGQDQPIPQPMQPEQSTPPLPAPPQAPVLPPVPVSISVPPSADARPFVKTESIPTADGGYRVIESTRVTRQVAPAPVKTYPTVQYGPQPQPQGSMPLPRPPLFQQTESTYESLSAEQASAAKFFDEYSIRNESVDWEVSVRRAGPDYWPKKNGVKLQLGELVRFPITSFADLRTRVLEQFGGGHYKLALMDQHGGVRRNVDIKLPCASNPPKNPKSEEEEEEERNMRTPLIEPKPSGLSELEKMKITKEAVKLESEIETAKAEAEAKKEEIAIRREARLNANPQVDAIREELRASKEQTAAILKAMQDQADKAAQQTRELIAALTNKPDGSKDMLALMQARMDREDQLRREQSEREEKARQDEKAREEARREREEAIRRDHADKEERYRREREEREERARAEEKAQQQQFVTTMMQMSENRNKESVPQMNMLMESIKALNEGNKTFIQAVIETSKASKSDLSETQKANAALVERTFQTIMETQKGDAGKYERLMEALISNKLESGKSGVEEFVRAMQMGEARSEKMFQLIREAQEVPGDDEAPAAPAVDNNQGFWNNLGNIVMALLLSRSGNSDVQQGVAAALGRPNTAGLTQNDFRQVAQGLTPLVASQMGMQPPPGMIPMPQQQPQMFPLMPQQQPQMMPLPQQPMIAPQQPRPQPVQPQVPFVVPPSPNQPQVQPQPVQPTDAESAERLRGTLDEMVETACNDLADEAREQQWVDYGLDYLPKGFLDALVQCFDAKRLDMAVAMIRQNSSVERFMRLEELVQTQSKYDLFMKGLVEMIQDHRETGGVKTAIPITSAPGARPPVTPVLNQPVQISPVPMPMPSMTPEPASGPPASAINAPITVPPAPNLQ